MHLVMVLRHPIEPALAVRGDKTASRDCPIAHPPDRRIDFVEREAVGNKRLELDATGIEQLLISWDIFVGNGLSAVRTTDRLTEVERQGVNVDVLAFSRHPD